MIFITVELISTDRAKVKKKIQYNIKGAVSRIKHVKKYHLKEVS